MSFTFDSTDSATRSVVAVGACVVTGLLLWSICTGKLLIMYRLWLPIANSTAVEYFIDMSAHVAEAMAAKKRTVVVKLR